MGLTQLVAQLKALGIPVVKIEEGDELVDDQVTIFETPELAYCIQVGGGYLYLTKDEKLTTSFTFLAEGRTIGAFITDILDIFEEHNQPLKLTA